MQTCGVEAFQMGDIACAKGQGLEAVRCMRRSVEARVACAGEGGEEWRRRVREEMGQIL